MRHWCGSGFEYQVGAHCLAEGLLDEGLTIIRAVSDRYHPAKRNPFNEIEYSDHYARALASYAALITASGFRHSGPDGVIGFAPVLTPAAFKSAFTTAEGWGSYQRSQTGQRATETITLKRGTLRLRKFECALPAGTVGFLAQARRNGTTLAASTDTDADGLTDLEETSGIDDPTTATDPRGKIIHPTASDTDGDGTRDGVEARLGIDPLHPRDYFHPLISMNATGQSTLTWPNATGTTFTDTAAPADSPKLFYRVHLD